jgi:hypothetical protein
MIPPAAALRLHPLAAAVLWIGANAVLLVVHQPACFLQLALCLKPVLQPHPRCEQCAWFCVADLMVFILAQCLLFLTSALFFLAALCWCGFARACKQRMVVLSKGVHAWKRCEWISASGQLGKAGLVCSATGVLQL